MGTEPTGWTPASAQAVALGPTREKTAATAARSFRMATHLTGPRRRSLTSEVFNRPMLSHAEISDRLEIQQLIVDYSTAIDTRRFGDLGAEFTQAAYTTTT